MRVEYTKLMQQLFYRNVLGKLFRDAENCSRRQRDGIELLRLIHYDGLRQTELSKCKARLSQLRPRLARLTDAFLEGILERELFTERKEAILLEEKELQEKLNNLENLTNDGLARVEEFLELAKSLQQSYELATPEQKRRLLRKLTSNLAVMDKKVDITLQPETEMLMSRLRTDCGAPHG